MQLRAALATILCVMLVQSTGTATVFDRVASREITLPAGTRLPVVLDTSVASNTSRPEQPITGHITRDVVIDRAVAVPAGSEVLGIVTDARRSGRVKGLAHIGIRFTTLIPKGSGERYRIQTSAIGRTAPATKTKDAIEIGAPAAGGAIVGGLMGGKKGALVGTAVGGGAGTAVVLSTRGKETGFARGTALSVRLVEPIAVRTR